MASGGDEGSGGGTIGGRIFGPSPTWQSYDILVNALEVAQVIERASASPSECAFRASPLHDFLRLVQHLAH